MPDSADVVDAAPNQRHWHYPANFEGAVAPREVSHPNLHPRTRQLTLQYDEPRRGESVDSITGASAYPTTGGGGHDDDVPEWGKDYGSTKKSSGGRKVFGRKKSKQTVGDWTDSHDGYGQGQENGRGGAGGRGGGYADEVAMDDGWAGASSRGGGEGRSNGSARPAAAAAAPATKKTNGDPNWEHEF